MTVQMKTLKTELQNRKPKKIGFPRIEDFDANNWYSQLTFMKNVRNGIIDMDDDSIPSEVKDNIEFTVDLSRSDEHLVEVKVKRNETRVEELKVIRERFLTNARKDRFLDIIDNDVLILYIDNFSRANFKRALPKTFEWFGKFVNSTEHLEAFEFFRYHTVWGSTYWSNSALYFASQTSVSDDINFVFRDFTNAGYMTGIFRDM